MFISDADDWMNEILGKAIFTDSVDIVVAPPFTSLAVVRERSVGTKIQLAGQNIDSERVGARTGEISAAMLKDAGCAYVILGHSERRQYFAETNETLNKKLIVACSHGLNSIFCVGESLAERNSGRANEIIEKQLSDGLANLDPIKLSQLIIAYEPIWAIGTGQTASPEQAQLIHQFIRNWVVHSYGKKQSEGIRIIYGGSVNPESSKLIINEPDIDGLLVGGASLKSDRFYDIINSL